jgi:hypothetical protein
MSAVSIADAWPKPGEPFTRSDRLVAKLRRR